MRELFRTHPHFIQMLTVVPQILLVTPHLMDSEFTVWSTSAVKYVISMHTLSFSQQFRTKVKNKVFNGYELQPPTYMKSNENTSPNFLQVSAKFLPPSFITRQNLQRFLCHHRYTPYHYKQTLSLQLITTMCR